MADRAARRFPTKAEVAHALREARDALYHERAAKLLRDYYDPSGRYAGGSFLAVEPNPPATITVVDLFALSLLDVPASPRGARNLLDPGPHRQRVRAALRRLPATVSLESASSDDFDRGEETYQAVKAALGANPWVTASKLCARKRPEFFPVRDNVVTVGRLGLGRDFRVDWHVFREILERKRLRRRIDAVVSEASGDGAVEISDPPLRVLDVVLWMTAPRVTRGSRSTARSPRSGRHATARAT